MLRTTALPAAVLLGVTLLPGPGAAAAAGESCQDRPATIVGSDGSTVTGTEGPDVIVTNGATSVDALGGDDLVCLTGVSNPGVDAGSGDDVVVSALAADSFPTIELGPGSDTFTGSAASEAVHTGGKRRGVLDDTDRDVVTAADYVVTGQPGEPNSDEVHVTGGTSGRGGTAGIVELHGLPTPHTVLDGGGGGRLVLETTGAHRVTIDAASGRYSRDEAAAPFSGFDDFEVSDEVETRYLTFRGSDRDETLTMTTTRNSAYDVRLGGGDDEVALETDRVHRRVNVFDGGAGRDQIGIVMPPKQVRLDLRRGRLLAGKPRNAVSARATAFEDAEVVAKHIEVTGTGKDNDIRALGCRSTVRALGGDDTVSTLTLLYDRILRCRTQRVRFEGGSGRDHLAGDTGRDVLLGGPGRDTANGRSGRDTCRAEKMRRCEIRR